MNRGLEIFIVKLLERFDRISIGKFYLGCSQPNRKIYIQITTFVYMEETVSVRISKEEMNALDKLSEQERLKRSVLLREVLHIGIQQKRLEYALVIYQKRGATAWKAARMAGIPLTKFLDLLVERGIDFNYTQEDFLEDAKEFV